MLQSYTICFVVAEKNFQSAKSMDDLGLLTICIFSKNRQETLSRTLGHFTKFDSKILVADATDCPLNQWFPRHIQYTHLPSYELIERFRFFAATTNSKYILLSPDDDFYLPEGLQKCVTFLENNQKFNSVQGLRIRLIYSPKFRWIPHDTHQLKLKLNSQNPIKRLHSMSTQSHYLYSVMRTDVFREIIDCFSSINPSCRDSFAIHELIFNYVLPIMGQHAIYPAVYSARTFHPYEGGDIDFSKWIFSDEDIHSKRFRHNILNLYRNKLNVNEEEARHLLEKVSQGLVAKSVTNKGSSRKLSIYRKGIKEKIKHLIERSIIRWLYLLKPTYFHFFVKLTISGNLGSFIRDTRSLFRSNNFHPDRS